MSPQLAHLLRDLGWALGMVIVAALAWFGSSTPADTAAREAARRRHPAYRARTNATPSIPRQRGGNGSRL